MSKGDLERFAVAQAMWEHLGKLVATGSKSRDGMPGELRAAADAAALDMHASGNSDRIRVSLNGMDVGAITVRTAQAWLVKDRAAYNDWCDDGGLAVEAYGFDWSKVPEEERRNFMHRVNEAYPGAVTCETRYPDPKELGAVWNQDAGVAIIPETGEPIPGVEFATTVAGTAIEGFRMDGAKSGAAAKYTPVRTALAGMLPAKRVKLLLGDDAE